MVIVSAAGGINGVGTRLFPSTRLGLYAILFTATFLQYAMRFALNMSIVCMVVPPQQQHLNDSSVDGMENYTSDPFNNNGSDLGSQCEHSSVGKKRDFGYVAEFSWSRSQVGYALSAFFYAYIPMQLLSGWLADKFGVRHVLGTGMLVGGILSLLTPVAARLHYGLLLTVRLLMGFAIGVTFPCINSFMGKWVPPSERSTFLGLVLSGVSAGVMVSFALSGFLCAYSWTYIFYILGGVTVPWYISYMYVLYSYPEQHPRISKDEMAYITHSCSRSGLASQKAINIPWRSILTSPVVLGLCINHFAHCFLGYTVMTGIPLYMQDVLYFSIKNNGFLSSLPSIIQLVMGPIIGTLIDVVHRTVIKSRRVVRKTAQTLVALGTGAATVAVGYMQCEQRTQAVVMFCLIFIFQCFTRGGSACSPSDIAPRIGGSVYGMINCFGNIAGFLVPIAIGNLTPNGSQSEWQKVFLLTSGLVAVGWLCFVVLGSSEEQEWAKGDAEPIETQVHDEDMETVTEPLGLKKHDESASV